MICRNHGRLKAQGISWGNQRTLNLGSFTLYYSVYTYIGMRMYMYVHEASSLKYGPFLGTLSTLGAALDS